MLVIAYYDRYVFRTETRDKIAATTIYSSKKDTLENVNTTKNVDTTHQQYDIL